MNDRDRVVLRFNTCRAEITRVEAKRLGQWLTNATKGPVSVQEPWPKNLLGIEYWDGDTLIMGEPRE